MKGFQSIHRLVDKLYVKNNIAKIYFVSSLLMLNSVILGMSRLASVLFIASAIMFALSGALLLFISRKEKKLSK